MTDGFFIFPHVFNVFNVFYLNVYYIYDCYHNVGLH